MKKTAKEDRRSVRSQRLLSNALIALMQKKNYPDITVQDILEQADIGRSTFYAHYLDKEDLLFSNFESVLVNLIHHFDDENEGQLLSTVEFFSHVKENQEFYKALAKGRGLELLYDKGLALISQKIEGHMAKMEIQKSGSPFPLPILTNYLAGSFINLLIWWINHKFPYTPEEMDAIYQNMVMPGTLKVLNDGINFGKTTHGK